MRHCLTHWDQSCNTWDSLHLPPPVTLSALSPYKPRSRCTPSLTLQDFHYLPSYKPGSCCTPSLCTLHCISSLLSSWSHCVLCMHAAATRVLSPSLLSLSLCGLEEGHELRLLLLVIILVNELILQKLLQVRQLLPELFLRD